MYLFFDKLSRILFCRKYKIHFTILPIDVLNFKIYWYNFNWYIEW